MYSKTPLIESLFNKVVGVTKCSVLKKGFNVGAFSYQLCQILSLFNNYEKIFLFRKFKKIRNFLFRVNIFILCLFLNSYFSTNKISSYPILEKDFHYRFNQQSSLRFFYFAAWSAVIKEYKIFFYFTAWSAVIPKYKKVLFFILFLCS